MKWNLLMKDDIVLSDPSYRILEPSVLFNWWFGSLIKYELSTNDNSASVMCQELC